MQYNIHLCDKPNKEYVIKKGDTLSHIALAHYGLAKLYRLIADFNDISDPDLIITGSKILLPHILISPN